MAESLASNININLNNATKINTESNMVFDLANFKLSNYKTQDATGAKFSNVMNDVMKAKTQKAHSSFVDKAAKSNSSPINKKTTSSITSLNGSEDIKKSIIKQEHKVKKNKLEQDRIDSFKENDKKEEIDKKQEIEKKQTTNQADSIEENMQDNKDRLSYDYSNDSLDEKIEDDINKKDNKSNKKNKTLNDYSKSSNNLDYSSYVEPSPVFSSSCVDNSQIEDNMSLEIDVSDTIAIADEATLKQANSQRQDVAQLEESIAQIDSIIEKIANSNNNSNSQQNNDESNLETFKNLQQALKSYLQDDSYSNYKNVADKLAAINNNSSLDNTSLISKLVSKLDTIFANKSIANSSIINNSIVDDSIGNDSRIANSLLSKLMDYSTEHSSSIETKTMTNAATMSDFAADNNSQAIDQIQTLDLDSSLKELERLIKNNQISKKEIDNIINNLNSAQGSKDNELLSELSSRINEVLKNNSLNKAQELNENPASNSFAHKADIEFQDNLDNLSSLTADRISINLENNSNYNEQASLSTADEVAKIALEQQNSFGFNSNANSFSQFQAGDDFIVALANNSKNIASTSQPSNSFNSLSQELKNDILNQITNKLTDLAQTNSKKLTMVLRPNDLGRLSIELTTNKDGLTTNILAQNEDVRNYIEKNINSLRQQLHNAGVNVNNIEIKTQGQDNSSRYSGNYNQNENQNNQNNQNHNSNNQNARHNNQEEYRTIVANLNYDHAFANDFSGILSKTLIYSLN